MIVRDKSKKNFRNKLPRDRAITALQGIVYFSGVLNHNLCASLRRSGYVKVE